MMHNSSVWTEGLGGNEIPILADLTEASLDDLFRLYCPSAPEPTEQLPLPHRSPMRGQSFDVIVRPLPQLCPVLPGPAPLPERTSLQLRTQQSLLPAEARATENFAEAIVPKAAAPIPPSLPHEQREELLDLRAEVMQAVRAQHLQTLMLCGVEPGAGTSVVARQLTRLLAEYAQMKVAFLPLLPGREKKRKWFARRASTPPLQFLLRATELPNLVEIASANGTIALTELLCHCAPLEVLKEMKDTFDLIVVDAPALATYSDAARLAALLDGVILVAEPNVTPLRQMDCAHQRLRKARANVLGMVFHRQERHGRQGD